METHFGFKVGDKAEHTLYPQERGIGTVTTVDSNKVTVEWSEGDYLKGTYGPQINGRWANGPTDKGPGNPLEYLKLITPKNNGEKAHNMKPKAVRKHTNKIFHPIDAFHVGDLVKGVPHCMNEFTGKVEAIEDGVIYVRYKYNEPDRAYESYCWTYNESGIKPEKLSPNLDCGSHEKISILKMVQAMPRTKKAVLAMAKAAEAAKAALEAQALKDGITKLEADKAAFAKEQAAAKAKATAEFELHKLEATLSDTQRRILLMLRSRPNAFGCNRPDVLLLLSAEHGVDFTNLLQKGN